MFVCDDGIIRVLEWVYVFVCVGVDMCLCVMMVYTCVGVGICVCVW